MKSCKIIWTSINVHSTCRLNTKHNYLISILCRLLLRTNLRISDGLTNCSSCSFWWGLEGSFVRTLDSLLSHSREFLNSGINGCVFSFRSAPPEHSKLSAELSNIWFLWRLFFLLKLENNNQGPCCVEVMNIYYIPDGRIQTLLSISGWSLSTAWVWNFFIFIIASWLGIFPIKRRSRIANTNNGTGTGYIKRLNKLISYYTLFRAWHTC